MRQYHARLIAGLAKKLQAVKEGDGTMLDNTLIVYLSDSGDGHHPTGYEWPMLLLGDLGGTLKTRGRFLQLPTYGQKATARPRTSTPRCCTQPANHATPSAWPTPAYATWTKAAW